MEAQLKKMEAALAGMPPLHDDDTEAEEASPAAGGVPRSPLPPIPDETLQGASSPLPFVPGTLSHRTGTPPSPVRRAVLGLGGVGERARAAGLVAGAAVIAAGGSVEEASRTAALVASKAGGCEGEAASVGMGASQRAQTYHRTMSEDAVAANEDDEDDGVDEDAPRGLVAYRAAPGSSGEPGEIRVERVLMPQRPASASPNRHKSPQPKSPPSPFRDNELYAAHHAAYATVVEEKEDAKARAARDRLQRETEGEEARSEAEAARRETEKEQAALEKKEQSFAKLAVCVASLIRGELGASLHIMRAGWEEHKREIARQTRIQLEETTRLERERVRREERERAEAAERNDAVKREDARKEAEIRLHEEAKLRAMEKLGEAERLKKEQEEAAAEEVRRPAPGKKMRLVGLSAAGGMNGKAVVVEGPHSTAAGCWLVNMWEPGVGGKDSLGEQAVVPSDKLEPISPEILEVGDLTHPSPDAARRIHHGSIPTQNQRVEPSTSPPLSIPSDDPMRPSLQAMKTAFESQSKAASVVQGGVRGSQQRLVDSKIEAQIHEEVRNATQRNFPAWFTSSAWLFSLPLSSLLFSLSPPSLSPTLPAHSHSLTHGVEWKARLDREEAIARQKREADNNAQTDALYASLARAAAEEEVIWLPSLPPCLCISSWVDSNRGVSVCFVYRAGGGGWKATRVAFEQKAVETEAKAKVEAKARAEALAEAAELKKEQAALSRARGAMDTKASATANASSLKAKAEEEAVQEVKQAEKDARERAAAEEVRRPAPGKKMRLVGLSAAGGMNGKVVVVEGPHSTAAGCWLVNMWEPGGGGKDSLGEQAVVPSDKLEPISPEVEATAKAEAKANRYAADAAAVSEARIVADGKALTDAKAAADAKIAQAGADAERKADTEEAVAAERRREARRAEESHAASRIQGALRVKGARLTSALKTEAEAEGIREAQEERSAVEAKTGGETAAATRVQAGVRGRTDRVAVRGLIEEEGVRESEAETARRRAVQEAKARAAGQVEQARREEEAQLLREIQERTEREREREERRRCEDKVLLEVHATVPPECSRDPPTLHALSVTCWGLFML